MRLRRREGQGFGQAVRQLLHIGDARTMRLAAQQGLLDGEDPRELVLKILKNRSAALGAPIPFRYYPAFSCFEEA